MRRLLQHVNFTVPEHKLTQDSKSPPCHTPSYLDREKERQERETEKEQEKKEKQRKREPELVLEVEVVVVVVAVVVCTPSFTSPHYSGTHKDIDIHKI
jgi:hypothetical protein